MEFPTSTAPVGASFVRSVRVAWTMLPSESSPATGADSPCPGRSGMSTVKRPRSPGTIFANVPA